MIDSDTNQDYYQIPSDKILQNRRAFYTLWRRCDDGTERWSKRIQSCIRRCDFPMIIMEFLLFDRFVCGLDDDKLKSAESVNKSWTLKQLLEFYADKNTDVARTGPMKSKSALNDNVRPSKNVAHNVRRSDPNEDESFQVECSELVDESDPFAEIEPNLFEEKVMVIDSRETSSSHPSKDDGIQPHVVKLEGEEDYNHSAAFDYLRDEISHDDDKKLLDGRPVDEKSNDSNQNQSNTPNTSNSKSKRQSFPCDLCNKSFNKWSRLRRHKVLGHQLDSAFLHSCEDCGKSFSHASHLKRHFYTHTGERPHSCHECDKSFTTKQKLKTHLSTHATERPFACDRCNKAFKDVNYLRRHKQVVHDQIRLYECPKCDKRFSTAHGLQSHTYTHTGERPFACDECSSAFSSAKSVSVHKLVIHQRILAHACPHCDKRCSTAQNLRKHIKNIHTKT